MPLTLDLADYVLGTIAPHELPALCLRALEAGHESLSLAALAGMTAASYERWEAEELWAAALGELGVILPSKDEAANLIIDDALRRSLRGETTPWEAVSRIVAAHHASDADQRDQRVAGGSPGLGGLVGIYWMYDEVDEPWGPSREQLDHDALEELRSIAERRGLAVEE